MQGDFRISGKLLPGIKEGKYCIIPHMEKTSEQSPFRKAESAPAFDPIKAKAEIFKDMKVHLPELRKYINEPITTGGPVADVFGASIEDGLELARQLRLTPEEIQKVSLLKNPIFSAKHPEVIKQAKSIAQEIGIPEYNLNNLGYGSAVKDIGASVETYVHVHAGEWKEFTPELETLMAKVEDYYAEFLPYRLDTESSRRAQKSAETIPETDLEKRQTLNHLRQGEDILFKKYIQALEEEARTHGLDAVEQRLRSEGVEEHDVWRFTQIVQPAIKDTADAEAKREVTNKKEEEDIRNTAFPSIVLTIRGEKREFNLARDRKPVQKIIEQVLKREMIKDVENVVNRYMHGRDYVVIEKDPVLGKYIPSKISGTEVKHHEQEDAKIKTARIYEHYGQLFTTVGQPKSDSLKDINTWIKEVQNTDAFDQTMKEAGSIPNANFTIEQYLELAAASKNVYLQKYLEADFITTAINEKDFRGISTVLSEMAEGTRSTVLNKSEIGALFQELEESAGMNSFSYIEDYKEYQRVLDAVNAMENPTMENLSKYFVLKNTVERTDNENKQRISLKERISKRLEYIDFVRKAMVDKIKGFLSTISAKPDQAPRQLAERLMKACYPKEWHAYEERERRGKEEWKAQSAHVDLSHSMEMASAGGRASEGGLTQNRFEDTLAGGNIGGKEFQEGAPTKIATYDVPVQGMFVTNILGYDPVARIWKRNYVPVDGDSHQERKTQRVTARVESTIGRIIPAPIGTEHFEVSGSGHIVKDSLGLLNLEGSRNIESWSYDIPAGTVVPSALDEKTYTRFLSRFVEENGAPYLEKNPELPVECKMFVDSIKTLAPRERLIQIQQFVTGHSFYDAYDNPIRNKMNAANFSERCQLMQERLEQIRDEIGDQVPESAMFGGVCADFAMLTESMCREAGLASAVIEGYNMQGTEMNSQRAHAKTGVFWPDQNGKTVLAEIETTPSAITDAQRAAFTMQGIEEAPLLEEIQKAEGEAVVEVTEAEKEIQSAQENIESRLQKLEARIAAGTVVSFEERKALDEQVSGLRDKVAGYIEYAAKLEDVAILKGVLDSIRYSPVLKQDQSTVDARLGNMKFIQSEYARLEEDYANRDEPLERISHLGKNFLGDLDTALSNARSAGEATVFAEYVGKVGEYGGRDIPENHRKIWLMLRTYMRAKLI